MSLTSTRKSRGPMIVCEENILESTMEHRMRFAPSQLLAVELQALQLLAQQLLRPQSSALFRFLRYQQRDWSCPRPVSSFIRHPGASVLGFSPLPCL